MQDMLTPQAIMRLYQAPRTSSREIQPIAPASQRQRFPPYTRNDRCRVMRRSKATRMVVGWIESPIQLRDRLASAEEVDG